MATTAIKYGIKKTRNYRKKTIRKTTKGKRDLTQIFYTSLNCILICSGILSISLISTILYREISQSTYFQLKQIQVEGCLRHTPSQILHTAGIKPRINLLSLYLKSICQCLENSPWIERAKVKRILPNQLEISIIEREPVALINLNQLYLVDKKGTIFKKAERKDGLAFPVLTGVTWEGLMNYKEIHTPLITQALILIDRLKEEGINPSTISEIHLDATFGLTVFTIPHATQIEMGFPPFQEKCKRLCAIIDDLEQKNLVPQTIDLNYSHKSFVNIKQQYEAIESIKKGGENQWVKMEI